MCKRAVDEVLPDHPAQSLTRAVFHLPIHPVQNKVMISQHTVSPRDASPATTIAANKKKTEETRNIHETTLSLPLELLNATEGAEPATGRATAGCGLLFGNLRLSPFAYGTLQIRAARPACCVVSSLSRGQPFHRE